MTKLTADRILQSPKITNDGKFVQLTLLEPLVLQLFYGHGPQEAFTEIFVEKVTLKVTPNLRIVVKGLGSTEEMLPEKIALKLFPSAIFSLYSPEMGVSEVFNEKGEILPDPQHLLEMAGLKPTERYVLSGGFVFHLIGGGLFMDDTISAPYIAKQVRSAAHTVVQKANRWLHGNMRSFKRVVKPDAAAAVTIADLAQRGKIEIIPIKLGDTVTIVKEHNFLRKWRRFQIWGDVPQEAMVYVGAGDHASMYDITFNSPAVIYTACGDDIGGRRTFRNQLFVVDPNGDLAARAK